VVTDEQTKQETGKAYREAGTAYIKDTVLANPDTDDERRRVYTQTMHTVDHLAKAPVIIVACLTQPCPDDAATGPFGSIYPAAQNLMLAARSRDLGSVLLTLATDYSPTLPHLVKPVKEILGLPEDVASVALIPVGYPKGQWGRPRRQGVANSLHWEKW
jgi:nitroreductase